MDRDFLTPLHTPWHENYIMASASTLLTWHKEDPFYMRIEKNSCLTRFAHVRQAALNRLDDLVATPWHADSKKSEEAARVRRDIEILNATNELDAAMLLIHSHSCNVCNRDVRLGGIEQTSPTDLADALIKDTQKKLNIVKHFASRIANRNSQIEMLENCLKTLSTILKSVKIVSPSNIACSYDIDPINGISLIIQGPDNSDTGTQTVTSPTDLLDSLTPQSLDTPVLEAIPTLPPTPVLGPTSPSSSPSPSQSPLLLAVPTRDGQDRIKTTITATTTNNHTWTRKKKAITKATHKKIKIPSLSIWDTVEDRNAAYCRHKAMQGRVRFDPEFDRVPLIFTEGLYRNPLPHADLTTQSRMVIFSGLEPSTSYAEVLDRVRGGPILHATRPNSTTAVVSFVECRDAHAYVKYVNAPPLRDSFYIQGVSPRVTLADTPSYPLRGSHADLIRRGVRRCLEIPNGELLRNLRAFFTVQKLWTFTETDDIFVTPRENEYQHDESDDDEMLEDILVDDYVSVDHNEKYKMEPKQTPKPPPPIKRVIRVSFRDLVQAERAFGLIKNNFRGCGVRYIPDPCAGPLQELDLFW
ncbi:hypothetical protein F4679DRAFT_407575 [Xylaria curta]|nr:hypothetical protein F4679DRAFT_407575 [Xylaria curta]